MRLRLLRSHITYGVLILYVLIPMLDGIGCAGCIGNAPFLGETTIAHLQACHEDVAYASHDEAQSKIPDEQNGDFHCSICANVLMGAEVFSLHAYTSVTQWHGPRAVPALSELYHSINKPPQNLPV